MFTKSMHSKIENRPLLTMRWKTVYSMYGKDDFPSIIDSIRAVKYTEHFLGWSFTSEQFSRWIEGTFQKSNKGVFGFKQKYRQKYLSSLFSLQILLLSFYLNITTDKWCFSETVMKKKGGILWNELIKNIALKIYGLAAKNWISKVHKKCIICVG